MKYENRIFDEERALYALKDSTVENCTFDGPADGESAFKEASGIKVKNCFMNLRYPFWHVTDTQIAGCELTQNCRAALCYDKNIAIDGCTINGIKAIRECSDVTVSNTAVNSEEFIWKCRNIFVKDVTIGFSEYPFFEVDTAKINGLKMTGKYSFQYCNDIEITASELDTKDAFWHSKNVTVRDSIVKGEYLGWYSENLTLINCRIIGTQPFCYCKNLVLKNCIMEKTDLAFERSTVDAEVQGKIESIKNPLGGKIIADCIGKVIMKDSVADASKTQILCRQGDCRCA